MIIKYLDVLLRAIEETDLELIREMINDPEIEKMTGGTSFPISMYQQKKWFESINNRSNELRLMIETKDKGTIGLVALTDIDYKNGTAEFHAKLATSKNIRGSGFGTKAYCALINYAFYQMNLNCIYTGNIEYNNVTERVKEKIGFKKEGVLRERVYKNGKYYNIHVWSILKSDWEMLNANKSY